MTEAASGMKTGGVAIGWGEQKTKKAGRDYVVDVGCCVKRRENPGRIGTE